MLALLARLLRPAPPGTDRDLGRAGERAAARFLRRAGYRILARNLRLRFGEADLVCLAPDRRTIVIVEVKTRRRGAQRSLQGEHIPPEASVHHHKRRKLRAIARALVNANRWHNRPIRIDIIAVEWPADGAAPLIRHHPGAV